MPQGLLSFPRMSPARSVVAAVAVAIAVVVAVAVVVSVVSVVSVSLSLCQLPVSPCPTCWEYR